MGFKEAVKGTVEKVELGLDKFRKKLKLSLANLSGKGEGPATDEVRFCVHIPYTFFHSVMIYLF